MNEYIYINKIYKVLGIIYKHTFTEFLNVEASNGEEKYPLPNASIPW